MSIGVFVGGLVAGLCHDRSLSEELILRLWGAVVQAREVLAALVCGRGRADELGSSGLLVSRLDQ